MFGLDFLSYPELHIIETEMKNHYLLINSVNALALLIEDNSSLTFRCVEESVLLFKDVLPHLKKLKDHGIKHRHWEELAV